MRMIFSFPKPQNAIYRAALTLVVIGIAFSLRVVLLPPGGRVIYSTFYPAVAFIALTSGFWFGIAGMFFGGALSYYFLLPPLHQLKFLDLEQSIGLGTYFLAALIICLSLRELARREREIRSINNRLQDLMATNEVGRLLQGLVEVISSSMEMRDQYTSGHQRRVAELAVAIGRKMQLPERTIIGIRLAGIIHDLGKLSVPIEILTKPGGLNELEVALIQRHPEVAYEALRNLEAPWPLAEIIWQHHERMDGSGYPNHLKGDNILLEARILAVADTVEAMSMMRPYRTGLGIGAALAEITKGSGVKYDPAVVDACVSLFNSGEFQWHKD